MDGQNVHHVSTNNSVHDPVGPHGDLADIWIVELGHGSPRVWEVLQTVYGAQQSSYHDRGVMRGICFDERVNCGQVVLRALGWSRQEALFDLVVTHHLSRARLLKSLFDLGDEAQPLDRILNGGAIG
jgi:hypothetical protein